MRYELEIALRYLRARRKEAFISVTTLFTAVGVMIGVAALVVVLAVMGGFEASLRQRVLALSPQIEVQSYAGGITDFTQLEAKIDRVPGVQGSDPFIVGQAMVTSGRGIGGVVVRGIEPRNRVVAGELKNYLTEGSLSELTRNYPVQPGAKTPPPEGALVLGVTLAQKLKVKSGAVVRLVAPIIAGADAHLTTRAGAFKVGAIFDSGINFLDSDLVFMDLGHAQAFFGRNGSVDGIDVHLVNLDETTRVTAAIRALLPRGYRVQNWRQFNQAASVGFVMLRWAYAIVLLLLIGVAAFNLVATLIMVVMEKRKDIAVLMAMGSTPREVRLIFELKGLIIGLAGTVAGLALGAIICWALAHYHFIHISRQVYGISTVPIAVTPLDFALVAIASLVLCYVATIYPARQASRQMPVEIFRS